MAASDYRISVETAQGYTSDWRNENPLNGLKGFVLSREAIDAILETNDVEQLRIYFGKKDGKVALVYLGSDSEGKDILTNNNGESNIYDLSQPCPNSCDESSPLNQD